MGLPRLSTVQSADSHRKTATTVNQLITSTENSPIVSVKDFGARGDSNLAVSSGTDDTASIQNAFNAIGAQGGGALYFPAGFYLISAPLVLPKFIRIIGTGLNSSGIVSAHAGGGGANAGQSLKNGSAFVSAWPSNASTDVLISIEDICIANTNAANVGAAFYDNGGTQISLTRVGFGGFKYGVVLDQSELVDMDLCSFASQVSGGAGLWCVNGNSLTPGNSTGYTNRISVRRSQFNESGTVYGIQDDGGNAHTFADNNYNGCLNHIKAANVFPMNVIGGEFEAAASHCINITDDCNTSIHGGIFSATAGHSAIAGTATAPGVLEVSGCPEFSGGAGTAAITGCYKFALISLGVCLNNTGVALKDGYCEYLDIDYSAWTVAGVSFGGNLNKIFMNGVQLIGPQQAAIASDASGAANQATVNAILAALRTHGLIAT